MAAEFGCLHGVCTFAEAPEHKRVLEVEWAGPLRPAERTHFLARFRAGGSVLRLVLEGEDHALDWLEIVDPGSDTILVLNEDLLPVSLRSGRGASRLQKRDEGLWETTHSVDLDFINGLNAQEFVRIRFWLEPDKRQLRLKCGKNLDYV